METVGYTHTYPYRFLALDHRFPVLTVRLANPQRLQDAVEVDGILDSGTEISVFPATLAQALGVPPELGRPWRLETASGGVIHARRLWIALTIPDHGFHRIEPAFTWGEMARNLLGRDVFDLLQVGFRERHGTFFLGPNPS